MSHLAVRARQAVLPFAIAEEWQIACAYERSVKISHAGIFANRYLLAFASGQIAQSVALRACRQLGMPSIARRQFLRKYDQSKLIYLGFEDAGELAWFKVYLEFDCDHGAMLSHLGWKWTAEDMATSTCQQARLTYYRRLRCDTFAQHILRLGQLSTPIVSPSRAFTQAVLEASRSHTDRLICTHVRELNSRSSYDWNVYAADHKVGSFADELESLVVNYGLDVETLRRLMQIAATAHLGHVAGGSDHRGRDFCSLYYATI